MPVVPITVQEHPEAPPVCLEAAALERGGRSGAAPAPATVFVCLAHAGGDDLMWIRAQLPGEAEPACPPTTGGQLEIPALSCDEAIATAQRALAAELLHLGGAPPRPQRQPSVALWVGGGASGGPAPSAMLGLDVGVAIPTGGDRLPLAIELRAGSAQVYLSDLEGVPGLTRVDLAALANLRPQPPVGAGRFELAAGVGARGYWGRGDAGDSSLSGARISDTLVFTSRIGAVIWDLPHHLRLGLALRLDLPPDSFRSSDAVDPPLTAWITAARPARRTTP